MKWSHIAITGVLIICGVFLVGFKKPLHHKTAAANHTLSVSQPVSDVKPLDLSLPLREVGFQEAASDAAMIQTRYSGLSGDNAVSQSKTRSLELKGNVIMSQEPEAEKAKSADGAGIIINLRH